MLRAKDWILIAGIFISFLGLLCMPAGREASSRSWASVFIRSADTGAFRSLGYLLLIAGFLIIFVSCFLPRK
jgi:uncharacterized membrane protein